MAAAVRFPAGVTVTVIRGGGRDERGNPRPTTEHPLPGWSIAPRSSEDAANRSDLPITGAVARGPITTPEYEALGRLEPTDRLRVPEPHPMAGTWRLDGEVGPYQSPFSGWTPGARVALVKEA